MNDRIDQLADELAQVTQGTRSAFGGLSHDQLNWKPLSDSWSIAQCLDHLVTTNRLYFPLLASMRTGAPEPTCWERFSPLSGLLGRLLIKTLSPEYPKRMKTSPKAVPSSSEIDGILDRFAQHQADLIEHFVEIPRGVNRAETIVTSPFLRWVTYSLDDCLTILVVHEKRHLQQAMRVMDAERFPMADLRGTLLRIRGPAGEIALPALMLTPGRERRAWRAARRPESSGRCPRKVERQALRLTIADSLDNHRAPTVGTTSETLTIWRSALPTVWRLLEIARSSIGASAPPFK